MYGSGGLSPEPRPQLVPSPSHGASDVGSPPSLEHYCMSDLDVWLRDGEVPKQEPKKTKFNTKQCSDTNNMLEPRLPSYGSPLAGSNVEGPTKQNRTASSCQWSVNVSIPSPATSFSSVSAESPTLYESSAPSSIQTKDPTNLQIPPISPGQIKRELPDFESYGVKAEDEIASSCQLSQEKIQQVHSLAMEQVSRDIDLACKALGISRDPMKWSAENVRAWFLWTLKQYNLPADLIGYFKMNGSLLCALTEGDFRRRAQQGGDILYAQLDIWKIAANMRKNGQNSSMSPLRAEESFLDINGLLNLWSTSSISTASSASTRANFISTMVDRTQSRSAPAGSGARKHRTSGADSTINMATERLPVLVNNNYANDGLESEGEISEGNCDVDHSGRMTKPGSHIHLWQFLKDLLSQPQIYGSCIRWMDRTKSVFKIEDSVRVARLWGKRKNRPAMNYDKLSRSIRQYYKKGIMKKTERSQRLVYQFCHPYGL
ncbi:DNA-binding protein D-ETS-4-like [Limulus polyphemus]|uniref:DNA-binding protein D-ETS-4-like n=1 Tax=Limulus polyphemus TaxID=6850 RepID=A0ABM1B3B8_LIMPO|nr:DNA-binding protein D-ETS-4-like [Limulus polyphemus]